MAKILNDISLRKPTNEEQAILQAHRGNNKRLTLKEDQLEPVTKRLRTNFNFFVRFIFQVKYKLPYDVSALHTTTVIQEFQEMFRTNGRSAPRLMINCPPRYGKSELCCMFVAWSMANNPMAQFLFISYSHKLAKSQTQKIREIMMLPEYTRLFPHVKIAQDTFAKDWFKTTLGGSVYSAGSGGSITGFGAGVKQSKVFGGAIIIDDIHKPASITSETIREEEVRWYANTLLSRLNDRHTPVIFIGQRLHEEDLPGVIETVDTVPYKKLIFPAITKANTALWPEAHTIEELRTMQEVYPAVFASQYLQNPVDDAVGIFKRKWFRVLKKPPKMLKTFVVCDTAETSKSYNDATVFSFFGIYVENNATCLHWLDTQELRIEPADLEESFKEFYTDCLQHPVKPCIIAIEKKSTGTGLISSLQRQPGFRVHAVERSRASGSKVQRMLDAQPYIAKNQISICEHDKHFELCIDHMCKINAKNTHRHDDIADTLADAINLAIAKPIAALCTDYTRTRNNATMRAVSDLNQRLRRRSL